MDCNKDEAARAKEIAEKKFSLKEYAGAKKFALKALNLYPALEGLPQFLSTLNVYISAENKINGEMDWYGILGVNPFTDDETIRKQYKVLALTLHPDKNKSLGSEGAFKFVSEAWSLLSDKAKRLAYNQSRNLHGFQHIAPKSNHVGSQSKAPGSNGSYNLKKNATPDGRPGNNNARAPSTSTSIPPPHKMAATFWTICNRCKIHYQYLRVYMNQSLLCPSCKEAFVATEKGPPPNAVRSSNWASQQYHQNPGHLVGKNHPTILGRTYAVSQDTKSRSSAGMSSFNNTSFQHGPHSGVTGFVGAHGSSSVTAPKPSKKRREFQGAPSNAASERNHVYKRSGGSFSNVENRMKKIRIDDIHMYRVNHMTKRDGATSLDSLDESGKAKMGTERSYGFPGVTRMNYMRELSLFETRNMLINKAQFEIHKKLQEWRSTTKAKVRNNDKGHTRQKITFDEKTTGPEKHGGSNFDSNSYIKSDSIGDTVKKNQAYVSISVPDPDFHNFDLERSENSFTEDQIWAAYDDEDGMPRFYARIHKVISLKPFKIQISWLNSRSNSELGPINWVGSGFYKTCGDFRAGRHEITESLNSFSHKVRWTKDRGVIHIFPGKGEVWALYKNWSPDWNESTPDEVIHKYDMVEVLQDITEEEGVLVTPLVKVDGFKTVFRRNSHDHHQVMKIPRAEMFRFSHQVPSYSLTGQEAHNAPKGCRELDPAATPLDLLQTVTEADEAGLDNVGKSKEDKMRSSPEKHVLGKGKNASKPRKMIYVR